jgi:hypothetical protein
VTGTRASRSPPFTASVASKQPVHRLEHRARDEQGQLERDRERHQHGDDHVEPQVGERRRAVGRQPADDHARDHVDERQGAEQLPAERDTRGRAREVRGQLVDDVLDHRPEELLVGEEVEDRRVRHCHGGAGEDDQGVVRLELGHDRREDRHRQRHEQERVPAHVEGQLARGLYRGAPRGERVALPLDPAEDRPDALPAEHRHHGGRQDRARLGEDGDRPELLRSRVRVESEQPERRQADHDRRDELEDQVEEEVVLPHPPVCALEQERHRGISLTVR